MQYERIDITLQSVMTKKERYKAIMEYFHEAMPVVDTELEYGSVFQLLIAVVLSAQCTDKRVNIVTRELFRDFPDAASLAAADEAEVYEYVKSVSYPNAKARHIVALAKMLMTDFGGEVPCDMDELVRLPGVGRKTANVMQAVAFARNAMPVDTHVYRVSHRLGLVPAHCNTPLKVEQELLRNIPDTEAANAHHWLLLHGRYVCKSLKPLCQKCPFDAFCPKKLERSKLR